MSEHHPEIGGSLAEDMLPSRAARRNEGYGYDAIRHVHSTLGPRVLAHPDTAAHHIPTEGFPRWLLGRFEQVWMIGHEAADVSQRSEDFPSGTLMHRMQRTIDRSLADGSGAHAAVALAYLLQLGVRPLDFMHTPGRGHAFVVIGRTPAVEEQSETHEDDEVGMLLLQPEVSPLDIRPETWGADAVVCDAHAGLVLRQPEILNSSYYFEYTPSESQLYVPVVQDAQYEG